MMCAPKSSESHKSMALECAQIRHHDRSVALMTAPKNCSAQCHASLSAGGSALDSGRLSRDLHQWEPSVWAFCMIMYCRLELCEWLKMHGVLASASMRVACGQ